MRRTRLFTLVVSSALLLASTASAEPSPLLLPVGSSLPLGKTSVARARSVLSNRAPELGGIELAHERSQALPDGSTLVRFAQRHAGLPVLSRGAAVLMDARGRATRFAAARVEQSFPADASARIGAAQAATAAERVVPAGHFRGSDARLAWLPAAPHARLVWVLYRGLIPGTPRAPVTLIDARTGSLVQHWDAAVFDRAATVYEMNPVKTPLAASVTLEALLPGATELTNTQLKTLNCIDKQTTSGGEFDVHVCELEPRALADAQGDFPYTFSSDLAPEDEFAEVSIFYHAAKAYAFYQSLGMPELELQPLALVANLRFPAGWDEFDWQQMKNPQLPLEPYDNAFYTPESPYGPLFANGSGGLWFGQGSVADFAYDGDVVYHELAHAMIDRTAKLEQVWHLDEQGASPAPGAMNEGLADYFSSALTGDGQIGEYAAKNVSYGFGGTVIRDLENTDTCPMHQSGEVHVDSTFFSGALWSVRQSLDAAQQKELDTAILTALIGTPSGDLGYEDMAELIAVAVESSPLGTTVATTLRDELQARGVLPRCVRVREYKGAPIEGPEFKLAKSFYSPGRPYVGLDENAPYAPGLFQIHRELKPDTETLKVVFYDTPLPERFGHNADPYTPALLVRFATDPIVFSYDAGVSSNAGEPVALEALGGAYRVELDVPAGATDVWLMIVNQGDEQGLYGSVTLTVKSPVPSTGGTGGSGGFGGSTGGTGGSLPVTGGAPALDAEPDLHPAGGCATRSTPRSTGWIAWLALAAALLQRRRRPGR